MAQYGYIKNFHNRELDKTRRFNKEKGLVKKLTDIETIELQKQENVREWVTYFRENPSRFAVEYLGLEQLTEWQQNILHMMFKSNYFLWIASRGLGKTFLIWLYCIIRCILYPGTKIVYTSLSGGAATTYMKEKVEELRGMSPNIDCEIENMYLGKNAGVYFFNGSYVIIRPPTVNALGARANCIIIDEYRRVDNEIIETVFQKFLTSSRRPRFRFVKDENGNFKYSEYPEEKNIEIYISSQSPMYEQSYVRFTNAVADMLKNIKNDSTNALCFPYYLGMRDGIITKDRILKDLKKEGADMSIFKLEYECVPFGTGDNKFFTNEMFSKNRTIEKIFIPMAVDDYIKHKGDLVKNPFYIPKIEGEKRILCVDTALTGNETSANTIIHCIRLIPTSIKRRRKVDEKYENYEEKYYEKHVVYIKNITENLDPTYQAKIIKRTFSHFEADFIAIDTQGTSLAVIYAMVKPTYDSEYNTEYPAYDSSNDEKTSEKCKEPESERLKVMYNVNVAGGSALDKQHQYNMYTRNELLSNHIKFPTTQGNGETHLRERHKYDTQNAETQAEWITVYKQCDALIAEAVNLERKTSGTDTRVILEVPKKSIIKRRDRIIALQYGLLLAQELEILDFQYKEKADMGKYNFSKGVKKANRNSSPFSRNFKKLNGFGWGNKRF